MTYAELVTMIQEYTQNSESSFVSNIPNFVKAAESDIILNTQISDLRKPSQGVCTTSVEYLSLPSDFLAPYAVAVISSGSHYFLLQKEQDFMRQVYPSRATTGRPVFYAIVDDDTLIMSPTPDAGYTIELHYFYKPTSIVSSSTSWIGDNAPNALLYASLVHAYGYMKGDADIMKHYKDEYLRALSSLQILTEGRVRKDTYRQLNNRAPV